MLFLKPTLGHTAVSVSFFPGERKVMCLRKPAYHGKPSQIPLEVTDLSLGLNHVLVFLFGLENTDLIFHISILPHTFLTVKIKGNMEHH